MNNQNGLVVAGATPLTAKEVKAQVNLLQEVMESVMKDKVHYGTIPGCGDRKTLLKAGAEKIMATFRLAAKLEVEDLSTSDCARYRVNVSLLSLSGNFVGSGIGECSSNEEKYMYRRAVNDEEFNETTEDRRREKWGKSYGKVVKVKQVRMNIADVANTVLKMAKKRALVDAVLTATAASDIFDQDLEEMPEEIREEMQGQQTSTKPEVKTPQSKSAIQKSYDQFEEARKFLGDEKFYEILGNSGYEKPDQIKNIDEANKILKTMADAFNASKKDKK